MSGRTAHCRHIGCNFLSPRTQEFQPGQRRWSVSGLPCDPFAKGTERKKCKGVFEYLAYHGIEVGTGEFAEIRISRDLKAANPRAMESERYFYRASMEPWRPAPPCNPRLARTKSLQWNIVDQQIGSECIFGVAQFKQVRGCFSD